jgi:ferric-dicitrate binding protein FerR (iron transport regulator)
MNNGRVWILLAKKKSGEATALELSELETLLMDKNLQNYSNEVVDKLWEKPFTSLPKMSLSEHAWKHIQRKLSNNSRGRIVQINNLAKKWIAAAVVILIAGASVFIFINKKSPTYSQLAVQQKLNKISTPSGSKTKVQLPDGTQVWLNANSQLLYDSENFGKEKRNVTLVGEGFFDVTKSEKIPFIISAGIVTIRVKGTAFNVKAYPKQKDIETTLLRGLIEITTKQDPERKIIVKPNEKIIIPSEAVAADANTSTNSLYAISRLQNNEKHILPETVWIKNNLEFDNQIFQDIAPQLESWFNVKIQFGDDLVKQRRFSGSIEKETLQQTLSAMQISFPFKYSITGNDVWIKSKN